MFKNNHSVIKSPPQYCEPRTYYIEKNGVIHIAEWSLQRDGYVLECNDAQQFLYGDETYEDIIELCQRYIS